MFLLDTAFALELLALGAGVYFILWAKRNKGDGHSLAKLTGYFISVLALLGMLCTTYYGFSYWSKGHFSSSMESICIMQGDSMGMKGMHGTDNHPRDGSGMHNSEMKEGMQTDHKGSKDLNDDHMVGE